MSYPADARNKGEKEFLPTLQPEERQKLLVALRTGYSLLVQDVAYLEQHAELMYYPQFGQQLLQIAAEEQAHIRWLRDIILALGGSLPEVTAPPHLNVNSWGALIHDLEEKERSCGEILIAMHAATHADTDIVTGLRRIYDEEARHREEIRDILMKSQPYTAPVLTRYQEQEVEKQTWLEQQKNEWFAQRQAEWEANGKQVPWAEWVREQGVRWTAELPNRELGWAQDVTTSEQSRQPSPLVLSPESSDG